MESFKCAIPSWDEIHDIAKKTAAEIKKSNFYPDTVIAIARGGLVPARLLCDFLHIKNFFSIKIDHWGLTATKDGKARLTQGLNTSLEGQKVLVVDDITDTGQSIKLAEEHAKELGAKETRAATLIHLNNSAYIPAFFGHKQDWAWIIFPWNYMEDLVNIIRKINEKDEKKLIKILNDNYNIKVDENKLRELAEHISFLEKNNK